MGGFVIVICFLYIDLCIENKQSSEQIYWDYYIDGEEGFFLKYDFEE